MADMPLEKLKAYMGSSPKPVDFDEYWERALKEMTETESNVTIKRSDFYAPTVDCYDMWFTGVRNGEIYVKLLKPKKIEGKLPAVLFFHGYTAHTADFINYVQYAASGYVVAAMACRGQNDRSNDLNAVRGNTVNGFICRGMDDEDPDNLHYRNLFLDGAMLARIVMNMEEVDENRVAVTGYSQGGALSNVCAALVPEIKLVVSVYPFLSDYLATKTYHRKEEKSTK